MELFEFLQASRSVAIWCTATNKQVFLCADNNHYFFEAVFCSRTKKETRRNPIEIMICHSVWVEEKSERNGVICMRTITENNINDNNMFSWEIIFKSTILYPNWKIDITFRFCWHCKYDETNFNMNNKEYALGAIFRSHLAVFCPPEEYFKLQKTKLQLFLIFF